MSSPSIVKLLGSGVTSYISALADCTCCFRFPLSGNRIVIYRVYFLKCVSVSLTIENSILILSLRVVSFFGDGQSIVMNIALIIALCEMYIIQYIVQITTIHRPL